MTEFNPGDGWRPWPLDEPLDGRRSLIEHDEKGAIVREWVREVPAPPLPTVPGWYARRKTFGALFLRSDGQWIAADGVHLQANELGVKGDDLELLELRAVTAKAVLDRVRQTGIWQVVLLANPKNADELDKIAREFGVTS